MADGSSMPPMLRLRRSSQSGTYTMTAVYAAVYSDSSTQEYIFGGGTIDLSGMLAADHIDIQIQKRLASGGTWLVVDTLAYDNAQPAGHTQALVAGLIDTNGVRVMARQTAGVLLAITCEWFAAKRLGVV